MPKTTITNKGDLTTQKTVSVLALHPSVCGSDVLDSTLMQCPPHIRRSSIQARVFREHHVLKRAWRRMQKHVVVRGLELAADEHLRRCLKARALRHWRKELARKQHAFAAAATFRRIHTLDFAWTRWTYALATLRVARDHTAAADRHSAFTLQRRSLHHWRTRTARHHSIRALLPVAEVALAKLRRGVCWKMWRRALHARRVQRQMVAVADSVYRHQLANRVMSVWRQATAALQFRRNATLLADAVRTHNLLGGAFRALRVSLARRVWAHNATAELSIVRDDLLLVRALRVWRMQAIASWEERMRGYEAHALAYCSVTCILLCFEILLCEMATMFIREMHRLSSSSCVISTCPQPYERHHCIRYRQ